MADHRRVGFILSLSNMSQRVFSAFLHSTEVGTMQAYSRPGMKALMSRLPRCTASLQASRRTKSTQWRRKILFTERPISSADSTVRSKKAKCPFSACSCQRTCESGVKRRAFLHACCQSFGASAGGSRRLVCDTADMTPSPTATRAPTMIQVLGTWRR